MLFILKLSASIVQNRVWDMQLDVWAPIVNIKFCFEQTAVHRDFHRDISQENTVLLVRGWIKCVEKSIQGFLERESCPVRNKKERVNKKKGA